VSGGEENIASGFCVPGEAKGAESYCEIGGHTWVGGGQKNSAGGFWSSIFGGKEKYTWGSYEAIP
jgi:hypothetical protein